jgi:L,D-peptidoglycan transpeptidase YkuD (ErfK/YbiS/YcfS/YnhG family)
VLKPPSSRREREARSNLVLIGAVGGLLLLAIVVVVVAALRPSGDAGVRSGATAEDTTLAPTIEAPLATLEPTLPATATPRQDASAAIPAETAVPPEKTAPEKMARLLPGSRQIIVITGAKIGSNTGTLAVFNLENGRWIQALTTPANFGKNGLVDGKRRTEGHLQTPTGDLVHRKLPVRPASVRYNSLPNERVIGRGTAIFIHCFEPPDNSLGTFTHGCVAISRADMLELFAILDPARLPCCAIGTLEQGSPTSIFAY